jgi:hypothetical protein
MGSYWFFIINFLSEVSNYWKICSVISCAENGVNITTSVVLFSYMITVSIVLYPAATSDNVKNVFCIWLHCSYCPSLSLVLGGKRKDGILFTVHLVKSACVVLPINAINTEVFFQKYTYFTEVCFPLGLSHGIIVDIADKAFKSCKGWVASSGMMLIPSFMKVIN